ncbi:hypothetical protein FB472_0707 [Rhodoglobus vestalii]|uniref:Quercetin dioxygenase-like cupin family protein n=1 Tax=Rhodoglobus vestalii TaxID=193384 RepID=A0A8H2K3M6_9MICO|nr:cupin domain-containing protein [Rhodoglobus vestalii]TQO19168.1 hypothetical protein FB472_0707 [Rhodoglobus vestalii]
MDNTTVSLTELAATELAHAIAASSGRSAHTIWGGHGKQLRQTLIALKAGSGLAEHSSPGEATLQVLKGRITLRWETGSQAGSAGDFIPIPEVVHAVDALEDSVILLTVIKPH